MSTGEIRWVDAFGTNNEAIKNQAKEFWKQHKVILREEVLNKRAEQLVQLAYNKENKIIAVSTALKTKVKLLNNNWLYQYRCFIDPSFRAIGFDVHLTQLSLQLLEQKSKDDKDKPIGVFAVIENKNLYNNKLHNAAVWRAYKMYFIGYNTKGQPIRVYYFKDAKI